MKQPKQPEDLEKIKELALAAARQVAACDWGTSVTELYHNARMYHMEQLREWLERLPK